MRVDESVIARFWPKVISKPEDGCWIWGASKNSMGYGQLRIDHRPYLAHRISYVIEHGDIPDGLVVRHRCDTPLCIRPSHLEIGTQSDNVKDMRNRGRAKYLGAPGERNGSAKLSDEQVREIRKDQTHELARLAREYGVTPTTIWMIQAGKSRTNILALNSAGEIVEAA
jgi:DNA-binding XRE family transcriptional regulator